ncbi:MAG: glycosyltransferase family 87 protein [Candidatus Dormibacteria bacterium]
MSSAGLDHNKLEELLDRRSRRLRALVLLLTMGISIGVAIYAVTRFVPPGPYGLAEEFRVLYAAAKVLAGGGNPYHPGALRAVEQAAQHYPPHGLQPILDSFAYLPVAPTLLGPLVILGFWPSYIVFTAVGLVALLVVTAFLARDLGWRRVGTLEFGVVACWIAVLGFSLGQFDALMFAVLGGAMLLAWHDRPLPAGLVLGLVWIKPDLLWPAPIFLFLALLNRRAQAFWFAGGFGATSVLCLSLHANLLPAWWVALRGFAASVAGGQPDLAGLPGLLGAAPKSWGLGVGMVAPGTFFVVAVALVSMGVFSVWMMTSSDWRRVSAVGRIAWGVGLPVAIWLAGTPYAHPNDDVLLLPLFMLTVGRDARRVHGLGLGLALLVLVWFLLIWPSGVIPWPVGLLALAGVAVVLWRRRTDVRLTGFGAGLCLLALAALPVVWQFQLLRVSLTPVAVLLLVVEGARTCWMEVGGAGTGPAYVVDQQGGLDAAPASAGG